MSALLLKLNVGKQEHAQELLHAQSVCTAMQEDVNLALHIVPLVSLKLSVNLVFLDSRSMRWIMKEPNILIASKSVVMEEDSS